jgi:Rieske Fe-S protein
MTDESQQDQCATRRCVLLGAGVLGVAGVLTACSTAAVPYGANAAGQAPSSAPSTPAAAGNGMSGGMASQPASTPSANGGSGNGSAKSGPMGTVLGMASEVPVGGGKVYTAAKVVVTQPSKGQFKAFSAVCTHVGCLCNQVADGTINCPCHGAKFKITDGSVVAGPAPAPLPAAKVTVSGGKLLLA